MRHFLITVLVENPQSVAPAYSTQTLVFESDTFPGKYEIEGFARESVKVYKGITSIVEVEADDADTFQNKHRR